MKQIAKQFQDIQDGKNMLGVCCVVCCQSIEVVARVMSYHLLDKQTSDFLISAVEEGRSSDIKEVIDRVDGVQLAYFLLTLTPNHRRELLGYVRDGLIPEILLHLVPGLRKEVIKALGTEKTAFLVSGLDSGDIVEIIEDLDEEYQNAIIDLLPEAQGTLIRELLSYPEKSAGRLIYKDITVVPEYWNVEQLVDFLCNHARPNKKFHEIFVINPQLQPVGILALDDIIRASRNSMVRQLMNTDIKIIRPGAKQEEVSEIFRQYSLLSAPVVNKDGRIIGSILVYDIINVVHQEAEEDVLRMGMVSDGDVTSSTISTVVKRLPWLLVNLLTSSASSIVIGWFSETIRSFIALSIIMPMIASMSGNSGLQALTVTIRALATKQLTYRNSRRLLFKELCVGFVNGAILAAIASIAIIIRFHNTSIEVLFVASMIITFSIATFSGAAVPMLLHFFGADPAVSSSIIVCAASDIIAFLIFLGLATVFLM
ncbi:magnesium transporter [Anaplasma marginale]|uniref:Magnesium transporter MgtE n=2 Tax=Anaplasma marginale TaxID=770 RepID=A0A643CKZ7_ANAMA|nr:magnesium transporter [Anaplasma marginale]AAV86649.1 magnesium transporter [Anaplasma marginale str. St. Maries]AGZ78889.1 magnesium transporter [Anaplasma marginale str. Gypsy Plains]AXW84087.1 magnesium transporter [Anaplasma marginale]AXW85006.1 magnesium transporter [Anaplasma marginale]KAA8472459.1 magnesium transporter [Anaplasma marginale]